MFDRPYLGLQLVHVGHHLGHADLGAGAVGRAHHLAQPQLPSQHVRGLISPTTAMHWSLCRFCQMRVVKSLSTISHNTLILATLTIDHEGELDLHEGILTILTSVHKEGGEASLEQVE